MSASAVGKQGACTARVGPRGASYLRRAHCRKCARGSGATLDGAALEMHGKEQQGASAACVESRTLASGPFSAPIA